MSVVDKDEREKRLRKTVRSQREERFGRIELLNDFRQVNGRYQQEKCIIAQDAKLLQQIGSLPCIAI